MTIPVAATLSAPALFMAGAAASLHCAVMCGAWQALHLRDRGALPLSQALALLHAGRIAGYAALGALAGGFGGVLLQALPSAGIGRALQAGAAASLVVVGLVQLMGRGTRRQECCAPAPRALGRVPAPARLVLRGLLWALLPCAILYAMLPLAMFSASAASGALLLGAFGLGTVPALAGSAGVLSLPRAGRVAGVVLIGLGLVSGAAAIASDLPLLGWCHFA